MRTPLLPLLLFSAACAPVLPNPEGVALDAVPAPGRAAAAPAEEGAGPGLRFQGIAATSTDAEKDALLVSARATFRGVEHPIGFHPIAQTGQVFGEWAFGQIIDAEGAPILQEDGSPRFCNSLDFASLIQAHGELFLFSHAECHPGAIYTAALSQDPESGALSATRAWPVRFGALGAGLFCAGDVTPWGTHLAAEEYEADARRLQPDGLLSTDYHTYNRQRWYWPGGLSADHLYRLGWTPELTVADAEGAVEVVKHYSLGRFSHEIALVLEDERTVYLSDDGANGGLFLFVADAPRDLSAGTLYAAQLTQTSAEGGGAFDLRWISLGHATDDEIAPMVAAPPSLDALFERAEPGPEGCPEGLTSVNTMFGPECLSVREGMEVAASRLETRRYAAILGATTELTKGEGMASDPDRGLVYLAISKISLGMTAADASWDIGGRDHVQLSENPCGAIWALELGGDEDGGGGALDAAGAPIDSDLVAARSSTILLGERGADPANPCAIGGISNPDNITYLAGTDLLMIAEDTSNHENDVLWALDLNALGEASALTRVLSAPRGAEIAGLHWFPDVGGFGYLTVSLQHDNRSEAPRSQVGVLGPFPDLSPDP